jgi:hypothetical protein
MVQAARRKVRTDTYVERSDAAWSVSGNRHQWKGWESLLAAPPREFSSCLHQ